MIDLAPDLTLGVAGTSRKENEDRVALHPRHLPGLPREIRPRITFERGYGERFGVADREIEELGFRLASHGEVMSGPDVVLLPKPLAEDLREMREGAVLWGWPHCVQRREITQAAIDRRLTLIAFEAMFHWGRAGEKQLHTFYKNNELAGYCGILHALRLLGRDGFYGPARRAVVLGFGSVSRGAVYALQGRGITDITVYTQRPPHLVHDQVFGCRYRRMKRGAAAGETMISEAWDGREHPLIDDLVTADVIVNGTLQDTDDPLMFLAPGAEKRLRPGALIVDVSCDRGMGFPFARPTSFEEPTFQAGRAVYYAVDHTPTYLWDSATWEISKALLPYLEAVLAGPDGWAAEPTLTRAEEIRGGIIQNPKILSFQKRAAEYPHPLLPSR